MAQDLPVPEPNGKIEYSFDSEHSDMTAVAGDEAHNPEEDDQPVSLTQSLNFSKEFAQLLGSYLKEKNLLAPGTMFYWSQDCERELRQFFMFQDEVIIDLLQQHCWIDQINWLRVWSYRMETLLNHPAEVSKQFFYITGIVFHLSL